MPDKKMKPFDRINAVLKRAHEKNQKIAAHEFEKVDMHITCISDSEDIRIMNGREYVGYSEATIARRLREYAAAGMVTVGTREGKNFKEYGYVEAQVPAVAA